MRVLLVEDDSSTRRFLKVILDKLGYETTECETAEAGLEAYQGEPFPIALLDWMLPGMSGVELCRQIRGAAGGENTFILMSTSQDQLSDIEIALKAGADDYLIKPVDIKQMKIRLFIAEQRVRALQDQQQIKSVIQNQLKKLQAQHSDLKDYTCPAIALFEGILLFPISGRLDKKNIVQFRKRILAAIEEMHAKQVILDISQVDFLDPEIGHEFMKSIRIIQMLGINPILIGISASVAETLAEVMPDSLRVSAFNSLSDGLQAAMQRMKYKIMKDYR